MKILHITNNYPTSNHPIFGIFVKEQIDSLSKIGLNNTVFFINTREKGLKEYIFSYFRLIGHLITHKYDIVHCHHSFSAAILSCTFYPILKKSVVSFQNDPSQEFNGRLFHIYHLFFSKIILKNNSAIYMKYRKCINVPNGVDIDFFQPYNRDESFKKLKLDSGKKYILFMDSYKRRTQKRIDRFNEVIELLLKDNNPYNIEPIILTNTDRSLIPFFMSASTLHLLTSDFEGSPNSVKECLACNTKIVTTPVGNVKDLIGDVPGCFISNSFEPKELSELVKNAIKYESFQGRDKLIEKRLDIESIAKKLVGIYKTLLNEK